jgi:hypothetical protein
MMEEWKILKDGSGNRLAINDTYAVAAEPLCITVWKEGELYCRQQVTFPQPGFPRLSDNKIYWGPGMLDLEKRIYVPVVKALAVLKTEMVQLGRPSDTYRPVEYAWAPDGSTMAVSLQWSGKPGPPPAKVLLLSTGGELEARLWEDSDVPVTALCVSEKWVIAGTRQLRIFEKHRPAPKMLAAAVPAVRIEVTKDERRMMRLQYDHIALWDLSEPTLLHRWDGNWLDAAITPDGDRIVAVDSNGKLFSISTTSPFHITPRNAPGPVFSLALSERYLLAFFMDGAVLRLTTL